MNTSRFFRAKQRCSFAVLAVLFVLSLLPSVARAQDDVVRTDISLVQLNIGGAVPGPMAATVRLADNVAASCP